MGYIKDVKIGSNTHLIEPILYGTCSTAAATAEKAVDIPNFELVTGVRIVVIFTIQNTASQPTLNVNNTGAKTIVCPYSETAGYWWANSTKPVLWGIRYFIYDGSMWRMEDNGLSLSKYQADTAYGNLTFSGTVTLAADPTTNLGAATKQYVDTAVSGAAASIEVVRLI